MKREAAFNDLQPMTLGKHNQTPNFTSEILHTRILPYKSREYSSLTLYADGPLKKDSQSIANRTLDSFRKKKKEKKKSLIYEKNRQLIFW